MVICSFKLKSINVCFLPNKDADLEITSPSLNHIYLLLTHRLLYPNTCRPTLHYQLVQSFPLISEILRYDAIVINKNNTVI